MGYLIPTPPRMATRVYVPHCKNTIRTHSHDVVDGVEVCPYPEKPWSPTLRQWIRMRLSRFFAWIARSL